MNSRFIIYCLSVFCSIFVLSCNEENPQPLSKEKLIGQVQKGPFLNGTSISISELDASFAQTGKVFNTQITNNLGEFEFSDIQLISPYVDLKATGFYFNECLGENSKSQITLHTLADITDVGTLSVNVMTTLEKGRVEKLIADGLSFTDAKKKAQGEILSIFSLNKSDMKYAEQLDIAKAGDDNAILLAISVIVQGFRSESELSELLANLNSDIGPDGKLDSEVLQSALISHAKYLNLLQIRLNLEKRYNEMGVAAQIPDFEKYVALFLEKSTFKPVSLITYPETVNGIPNLLSEKYSEFVVARFILGPDGLPVDEYYYFSAIVAKGLTLKIKMEYVEGGQVLMGYWYIRFEQGTNWIYTQYDLTKNSQIFTLVESGKPSNQKMQFATGDGVKIRISYFENNDLVATKTRIITVK